jgi:hypothetical protein
MDLLLAASLTLFSLAPLDGDTLTRQALEARRDLLIENLATLEAAPRRFLDAAALPRLVAVGSGGSGDGVIGAPNRS